MSGDKRQALFGGSFDPIHNGHLMVAELLLQLEDLQHIHFVPAAQSPHKAQTAAPAAVRVRMIQAAVRDAAQFSCSTVEIDRASPSWTIDTVRYYARLWQRRPVLILGGDSLLDLHTWRQSEAILRESQVVVYARPGAEKAAQAAVELGLPYHAEVLSTLSSSALRTLAQRGLSLRWQVPEAVRDIIETEKLYVTASDSQDVSAQRHRHT